MRLIITAFLLCLLAGGARAEGLQSVSVGGVQLPTDAPLFIAMDKGYFARQGLEVKITWFPAAAPIFSAVVSRDIDIGVTATTAATFNLAAKGGFRIIGGYTREAPGFHINAFLVSNKAYDQGFRNLSDMSGKRIALTTAGSTHHYYIGLFAEKYGVDLKRISLVPLESYGNISAALQSGQVDAAILPSVTAERLAAANSAHILAWTGDEVPWQQGIVFASPRTLAEKHDLVARFMTAYAQGAAEYNGNFNQLGPDGKLVRGADYEVLAKIIAEHAGIKPGELEGQTAYIDPGARFDEASIQQQIGFWQAQGLVPKGFDFSTIFDSAFEPK